MTAVPTSTAGVLGDEANHEVDHEVAKLRNPDSVSEAAMKNGLALYRKLMACEDPLLKAAVQSSMLVRSCRLSKTVLL